jgi:hypothetical protein
MGLNVPPGGRCVSGHDIECSNLILAHKARFLTAVINRLQQPNSITDWPHQSKSLLDAAIGAIGPLRLHGRC